VSATTKIRSPATAPIPSPRSSTARVSATVYVGGSSAAPTCAHAGSIATGKVMPQASTKTPRVRWTTGPISPYRSTSDANSAPMAYSAGIPTIATTIARSTASNGSTTPKSSHIAGKITAKSRMIAGRAAIGGAKSGTSRDVGVRKTASREPRTCSVRSADPGPQSIADSHMYIA
jgi:hypothetical protein